MVPWPPFSCVFFMVDSGYEGTHMFCPGADALPDAAGAPVEATLRLSLPV